ncbi:peptidoglycan-binding domain-containing protein [Desulfobacterales bacterium HSG16]|nr:peptidoglycan-binding domain-containing protein [Desulfobacterales bacterium HSG16]
MIITAAPSCSHSDQPVKIEGYLIEISENERRSLFRRLEYAGFAPGEYSETNFTQLTEAVKKFQRFAKIEDNGMLDGFTWNMLKKLYDPEEKKAASTKRSNNKEGVGDRKQPAIHKKARWPENLIKVIREMLADMGYDIPKTGKGIDGRTQKAIRHFQEDFNIKKSGQTILDSQTFISILETYCTDGCDFNLILTGDDINDLADLFFKQDGTWNPFSETFLEVIAIRLIQSLLNELGYNAGMPDGVIRQKTREAVSGFQQDNDMKTDGLLSKNVISAIFTKACNRACVFSILKENTNQDAAYVTEPEETSSYNNRPINYDNIALNSYPINIDDRVFAVEKMQCSDISGDWIIFYQGIVTQISGELFSLRLEKRFGYRFHPEREGINNTDWWCVPRRRHCYSAIKFDDWKGKYEKNMIVQFEKDKIFNSRITIINGISRFLQQNCNRK